MNPTATFLARLAQRAGHGVRGVADQGGARAVEAAAGHHGAERGRRLRARARLARHLRAPRGRHARQRARQQRRLRRLRQVLVAGQQACGGQLAC